MKLSTLFKLFGLAAVAIVSLGLSSAGPRTEFSGSSAEAGNAVIAGTRMSCHAANIVMSNQVPGPGFALTGSNTIIFGPKFLRSYPAIVQRLIFLHECGHLHVGTDETAADCWAVTRAKRQGWLSPAGIRSTCRAIWDTAGGNSHLPGPERCQKLVECYDAAPSRKSKSKSK